MPLIKASLPWGQRKPPYSRRINRAHPLSQGLVGAWVMNEGGGGAVYDSSGNNNTGVLSEIGGAALPAWTSGAFGPAVAQSRPSLSIGSYINCGTGASLIPTKALTFSMWINGISLGSDYYMLFCAIDGSSNGVFETRIDAGTSKLYFNLAAQGVTLNGATALSSNTLYHIVFTYDGANMRCYINGIQDASVACTGNNGSTSEPVCIGLRALIAFGGQYPFKGTIDNVLEYSRALSASEVQQLYAQPFCFMQEDSILLPVAPPVVAGSSILLPVNTPWGQRKPPYGSRLNHAHPLAQGLAGAWVMNEGGGLSAYDISGNSNTGALTNGVTWNPVGLNFNSASSQRVIIDGTLPGICNGLVFSYGLWVKTTQSGTGANAYVMSPANFSDDTPYASLGILTASSGIAFFSWRTLGGSSTDNLSATVVNDGKWHHLFATSDGTTGKLYIDGKLEASSANPSGTFGFNRFSIGVFPRSSFGQYYTGAADNAVFYNRALSASEVQQLYAQPFAFMQPRRAFFPSGTAAVGTTVFSDTAALMEWLSAAQADKPAPEEYIASVLRSSAQSLEYLGTLSRDGSEPEEYIASRISDSVLPLEYTATISRDAAELLEYLSSISRDAINPEEYLSNLSRDAAAPEEYIASLTRDAAAPEEYLAGVQADRPLLMEWAGALSVIVDAALPIEWLTSIRRDATAGDEYLLLLTRDAASPLEYLVSIARNSAIGMEYLGAARVSETALVEWLGSANHVLVDESMPIEWRNTYPTPSGRIIDVPRVIRIINPNSNNRII